MQKFIAKYGLAAHLAIMAAAPLFLFPFFDEETAAGAQIWLTSLAACWTLLMPSVFSGEMLHDSRRRVAVGLVHDPLFWVMSIIALGALMAHLNDGIQLAYDAEVRAWSVADPTFPLFPGSVAGCGRSAFVAAFSALVAVSACRHSLGRAARQVFVLVAASLSGLAGLTAIYLANQGNAQVLQTAACEETMKSFVGMAFGLHLIGGVMTLVTAFERKWTKSMPTFLLAIGGNAAGLFVFAPAVVSMGTVAAVLLLFSYSFLYARMVLRRQCEFKCFVFFALAIAFGAVVVHYVFPPTPVADRLEACLDPQAAFLAMFDETRSALSAAAFRIWKGHLWIGSGLGAFPLELRFTASAEDWKVIPHGMRMVPNGWWQVLAERGVVGGLSLLLPLGFLLFTYFKRLVGGVMAREWPHPAFLAGPLALTVAAVFSFFDCSFLRADVLAVLGALLSIAAGAFPKMKR